MLWKTVKMLDLKSRRTQGCTAAFTSMFVSHLSY